MDKNTKNNNRILTGLIVAGSILMVASVAILSKKIGSQAASINRMIEVAQDLKVWDKLLTHEMLMNSQGR